MKIVKTALIVALSLATLTTVQAQEAQAQDARVRGGITAVPPPAPANGTSEQFAADIARISASRAYQAAQRANNPRAMQQAIAALGLLTAPDPEPADNLINACVSAGGTIYWGTVWTVNGWQSGWLCRKTGSNAFFAHNSTL